MGRESITLVREDDRHWRTEDGRFLVKCTGRYWTVTETSGARVFGGPGHPRASSAVREDLAGIRLLIFLVLAEEADRRRRAAPSAAARPSPETFPSPRTAAARQAGHARTAPGRRVAAGMHATRRAT